MAKSRILVVDDEEGMLEVCFDTLSRLPDIEILLEQDSSSAARRLALESVDLLIADIRMPRLSGLELLRGARRADPNLAALILTAYPAVETAVETMKLGAADYIVKPFQPEDLLANVRALLETRRLRQENFSLRRQVERSYGFGELLGKSLLMQQVFKAIQQVSQIEVDVLVAGETGTGKELVARAIHQRSRRADGPFVPVDCGAIPNELMESEFFGHERGAFTGAQSQSFGLLELANHGTFFLDELTQLPLRLQAKLLRALQERTIRRVGGSKEIPLDVRIVAATSLELDEEVRNGRFRLDLYHRIHVAQIDLPPLRDRTEDIPLLAGHFLARFAVEMERAPMELSPEALEILLQYPWPGNVRELQNFLKRTLAMVNHVVISPDDLPDDFVLKSGSTSGLGAGFFDFRSRRTASVERSYLKHLLATCHGDVSLAAREALLPRGTLYRLLKKHELKAADFRNGTSAQWRGGGPFVSG